MDAFEQLMAEILWLNGYWVQTSLKVPLDAQTRLELKMPNIPRPEIDLVAYKPSERCVIIVECKNWFHGKGVRAAAFENPHDKEATDFRILTNEMYQKAVTDSLKKKLVQTGLIPSETNFAYGLAYSKAATPNDRRAIRAYFDAKGWRLWEDYWIRTELIKIADSDHENKISTTAIKLLLGSKRQGRSALLSREKVVAAITGLNLEI